MVSITTTATADTETQNLGYHDNAFPNIDIIGQNQALIATWICHKSNFKLLCRKKSFFVQFDILMPNYPERGLIISLKNETN